MVVVRRPRLAGPRQSTVLGCHRSDGTGWCARMGVTCPQYSLIAWMRLLLYLSLNSRNTLKRETHRGLSTSVPAAGSGQGHSRGNVSSTGDLSRNRENAPHRWYQRVGIILTAIATLILPIAVAPGSAGASPCGPGQNPIVCENSKPGSPWQEWEVDGAGDQSIQGFATDISVNVGGKIDFKIDTDASAYTIDIYRTGWYQGLGARKVASVTPSTSLPQKQPECLQDITTELTDCGTWAVSASWNVPQDAVSGVYLAKLTRKDNGGDSHITFIVRDESSHADLLVQTSDPTWHAYNTYGGSDFYSGAANGRAYKISYNRPFATRAGIEARDFYFGAEYPMVRFLERNGYDVSYFSGVDTDRFGSLLTNHKTFLSLGHDEYWSGNQRKNVEAARDAGVNLQFLSGNEVYWHTRYEPSSTGGNDYRTLVSYKETWSNAKIDPKDEWTGTWRDPRFASPENGAGLPENGLTGTAYVVNNGDLPVTVDAQEGKLRLWRNTPLDDLPPGQRTALAPHTVGYESNEPLENGFRPPGLINLSTTTGDVPEYLQDFGNIVAAGTTTHHVTLYKAASSALVFSAGSIQWTWGLDEWHDGDGAPADPRMQQAEVNLLADMGAQPSTLMDGLVQAQASTDKTPPTVAITSSPSATVANGDTITVKGTAQDASGEVAGVEYSTDGGTTWKTAAGTTTWNFSTIQHGSGATSIIVRSIDDSGNYSSTGTSVPLNVKGPYSVFGSTVPGEIDSGDGEPVELGMRFRTKTDGYVSGVRFYKSKANTGTHTGTLWSLEGRQLATATFTQETADGWQSVEFDHPVEATAGTEFIVSYFAPKGHYSVDSQYFAYRGVNAPPLEVGGGSNEAPAGLYWSGGGYPQSSYERSNYYVDPVFESSGAVPLGVANQMPVNTAHSVPTSTPISAELTKPVDASTVNIKLSDTTGRTVPGKTTFDPDSRLATFIPDALLAEGTDFTARLTATDQAGNGVERGGTWNFRTVMATVDPSVCPCSLYQDSAAPAIASINDGVTVTLASEFSSTVGGSITGLKFYRSPGETGPHTGWLYNSSGDVIAQVEFPDDSVSGWQYAAFDHPVAIEAGAGYVAAYRSNGTYPASPGAFAAPGSSGPLRTNESAGSFTYGQGFPDERTTTSYLVDVRFVADPAPVKVADRQPAPGAYDVDRQPAISISFSAPVSAGAVLKVSHGGAAVTGQTTASDDGTTLIFTPDVPLETGTLYLVAPKNIAGIGSAAVDVTPWTFRTAGQGQSLSSFIGDESAPEQTDPQDNAPVELGLHLSTSQTVEIQAIRYFRGPLGTGTHTGALWGADGNRLANVTFEAGTTTGWQTAFLDQPIIMEAGSNFTVSYFAPNGGYVFTGGDFTSGHVSGPLSPDSSNGRFIYGPEGGLPTGTWNNSNYFADVLYSIPPSGSQQPTSPPPSTSDGPTATQSPSPTGSPNSPAPSVSTSASAAPTPTPSASVSFPAEVSWLFDHTGTAATGSSYSGESDAVELGLRLEVSQPITAYGIAFDKSPQNTGPHRGFLYSSSGKALATVTFTSESASGWQGALFDAPVKLAPGTYTVSYFAPHGGYTWAEKADFGSLHTGPVAAVSTNGRYRYGTAGGTVPTSTWKSTNYFVDLAFMPDAAR